MEVTAVVVNELTSLCSPCCYCLSRDPQVNSLDAILPYNAANKGPAHQWCKMHGYAAAGLVKPVSRCCCWQRTCRALADSHNPRLAQRKPVASRCPSARSPLYVVQATLSAPLTPLGPNAAVGIIECMKEGCESMNVVFG